MAALHSAVYYHALAHLELEGDAANLHDRSYLAGVDAARRACGVPVTPLTRAARWLARRYRRLARPGPLQALPLLLEGQDACAALLERLGSRTGATARFGARLRDAMEAELRLFFRGHWESEAERIIARSPSLHAALLDELSILDPLFDDVSLELHLCPALRDAGRGAGRGGLHVVATAPPQADQGTERLLFWALHELTHDAIDPLLERDGLERQTRLDAPGYAGHWRREQGVLAADYHLLRRSRPSLLPAYLSWCGRWVVPGRELGALRALAAAAGVVKPDGAWSALARVATRDPGRAAEAALEELLLVPEDRINALEDVVAGRARRRGERGTGNGERGAGKSDRTRNGSHG